MLEIRRLGHQPTVVDHEWGGAVVVALDQGRSDEQVPRCRGIDGGVVHLAPVGEGQAIERHALVGTALPAFFSQCGSEWLRLRRCPAAASTHSGSMTAAMRA